MTKIKQDRRMIPAHSRRWIALNFNKHTIEFFMEKYGCGRHSIRIIFYEAGLFRMKLEYWTEEQITYLKANYKTIGDLEMAAIFQAKWKKDKGWTKKHIEKKRMYLKLTRTKEEIAAIKLKHIENGAYKSGKTWDTRGRAPEGTTKNWMGACIMMKVNGKYIPAARCIFEAVFGPIPKGHVVKAIDGDNSNLDPLNLKLYTRLEACVINKIGSGSPELKEFAITLNKLNRKLKELENQKD
jgi:hypothetical protein